MSIRFKLLALFVLTLAILSGIGVYAGTVYQEILDTERKITEKTNRVVELSHQAETLYYSQLNAWKNVLLRGSQADNYHRYLQDFYQSERKTRNAIAALHREVLQLPNAHKVSAGLVSEHLEMGYIFREAIRVFNVAEINADVVADQYVIGIEDAPAQLLHQVIGQLQTKRIEQLNALTEHRQTQEHLLLMIVVVVLVVSFTAYLLLLDKSIVKPAARATYLADVIENAQRVAKFGTWDWDSSHGEHYWSDGLYDILGIDRSIAPSQDQFLSRIHEADRERVYQLLVAAVQEYSSFELEARIRLADGKERFVQQRGQVTKIAKNNHVRVTSIIYDVTERKESEKRLVYLANYDTLTSMPNRNLFHDRLKHSMTQAKRKKNQLALLYLDLDHFKAVNDALGHQAGDKLLIEASQRIKKCIRESDTAARLGGDEFTIILEQIEKNEQVSVVAQNLLSLLSQSYRINNNEVVISASMGITMYPGDGEDVDTLLRKADSAMYFAKEQGRNNYHFFTEELNQQAQERLILENGLRMALERDQFQIHFQPQIELKTGRIIGAEALLRWVPSQNGVSPKRFIPILEETGCIVKVGTWVLGEACKAAKEWQKKGYGNLCVAVNLAARQLRQADIIDIVKQALENSGLAPEYLEIELTESTLIDTSISKKNLKRLEKLGVRLAIDDFGTGYSSLSYLKQYSVDVLKIDRSFIMDINKDKDDDAVTSAMVALSHKLDMKVIAEGVETVEQLEYLTALGCDQAQGFLIAEPMMNDQFESWVKKYMDHKNDVATWLYAS